MENLLHARADAVFIRILLVPISSEGYYCAIFFGWALVLSLELLDNF